MSWSSMTKILPHSPPPRRHVISFVIPLAAQNINHPAKNSFTNCIGSSIRKNRLGGLHKNEVLVNKTLSSVRIDNSRRENQNGYFVCFVYVYWLEIQFFHSLVDGIDGARNLTTRWSWSSENPCLRWEHWSSTAILTFMKQNHIAFVLTTRLLRAVWFLSPINDPIFVNTYDLQGN